MTHEWNLYWFQAEQDMTSEIEMEDLRTRIDKVESLASVAGWQVELGDREIYGTEGT